MVHGDDYAAAGPRSQVTWLSRELENIVGDYYVKAEVLSEHERDRQEISFVKRVIRLSGEDLEVEVDVSHAEFIVR